MHEMNEFWTTGCFNVNIHSVYKTVCGDFVIKIEGVVVRTLIFLSGPEWVSGDREEAQYRILEDSEVYVVQSIWKYNNLFMTVRTDSIFSEGNFELKGHASGLHLASCLLPPCL